MTVLDDAMRAMEKRHRDEVVAARREHRRRMWADIYLPFVVGMSALAWSVCAFYFGSSEWVALLSLPGVVWCQCKLGPFLYGHD